MNKEYKASNNSYREHFKLHGYLSPTMIEELLDECEALKEDNDHIVRMCNLRGEQLNTLMGYDSYTADDFIP